MDFMKVFEETVREIKREVNLKVLKVPEIEQKVLDATNNEAWGPHGSALAEIARETKKFTECQMIMNVLWTRLTDTGANWRHVYKALTVVEYLVANGSDRAVDDIIEHTYQISTLSGFEYVEPNGKDTGLNVRKKVETILGLLNDREKIKAVRDKAASTRDKYVGLSSTGISYKSSSASFGGSSFDHSDRYGSFSSSRESETFKNNFKDKSISGEETEAHQNNKGIHGTSRNNHPGSKTGSKFKKGTASYRESTQTDAQKSNNEDEFDDFDHRGSSTIGSAGQSFNQVDLFGDSLIGDLMDAPALVQGESTASKIGDTSEVDLFADADFVSVPPCSNESTDPPTQDGVDLFAGQPAKTASSSSNVDLFSAPHSTMEPSLSKQTIDSSFDPFATVPLNTFEESNFFGTFTSHTDTGNSVTSQNSESESANKTSHPNLSSNQPPKNQPPKMDPFQVKSGIWADSLSRGLINLNISAPAKTSLVEVGVVGGLNDSSQDKEKGPTTLGYKGTALSMGTGLSRSGFSSMGESGGGSFSAFGSSGKFQ